MSHTIEQTARYVAKAYRLPAHTIEDLSQTGHLAELSGESPRHAMYREARLMRSWEHGRRSSDNMPDVATMDYDPIVSADLSDELLDKLTTLTTDQQLLVTYFAVFSMPAREIGIVLDCTESAIHQRLATIRRAMAS